jgi:hypothetical protein
MADGEVNGCRQPFLPRCQQEVSGAQLAFGSIWQGYLFSKRLSRQGEHVSDGFLDSVVAQSEVVAGATKQVVTKDIHLPGASWAAVRTVIAVNERDSQPPLQDKDEVLGGY